MTKFREFLVFVPETPGVTDDQWAQYIADAVSHYKDPDRAERWQIEPALNQDAPSVIPHVAPPLTSQVLTADELKALFESPRPEVCNHAAHAAVGYRGCPVCSPYPSHEGED